MEKTIRAGLVGYGKSARIFHAPLISATEGILLKSVIQRNSDSALDDYPGIDLFKSFEEQLADTETDLLIITTPNHLHYEQAEKALKAGKHVVVEKPFTVTNKEAIALKKLAVEKKKMITVFQNRRFDGDFITLKNIVQSGETGVITEFESSFNRFRNQLKEDAWKEKKLPGSGLLYDLGPHLIDQALQLFGEPVSVFADIRSQRGGEADDYFEVDLFYSTFKARLRAGMLVPEDTPRFLLRGRKGSYLKYGLDPQEAALNRGLHPLSPGWGAAIKDLEGKIYIETSQGVKEKNMKTLPGNYSAFYRNVASSILRNESPEVSIDEAVRVIEIIELAFRSNREGRKMFL